MSKYQTDYQEISNELEDIHDGAALHWVHWCVLAGSLVLTFGAWYFAKLQIEEKTMLKFDREVSQVVKLVSERMSLKLMVVILIISIGVLFPIACI